MRNVQFVLLVVWFTLAGCAHVQPNLAQADLGKRVRIESYFHKDCLGENCIVMKETYEHGFKYIRANGLTAGEVYEE